MSRGGHAHPKTWPADREQRQRAAIIGEWLKTEARYLGLVTEPRRFPPPWSVEETDACFIVRDANGQALAYVYFEEEPGRRAAAQAAHPRRGPADRRQHHTNFSSSKLVDQID